MNARHPPDVNLSGVPRPEAALPPGTRLGAVELQQVVAHSRSSVVYLAIDHALGREVAIQEYLPAGFVQRDAALRLRAVQPWQEDVVNRGLRAFIDEAAMLARCDHPALVRVNQLVELHGTAYRTMPWYDAERLVDLRSHMHAPPSEAAVRRLLDDLLGALEAIHRSGSRHGGVVPANILMRADGRPLLLGPGAAAQAIGNDLVEALMAGIEAAPVAGEPAGRAAPGSAIVDLRALAEVARFWIVGNVDDHPGEAAGEAAAAPHDRPAGREPLAATIARSFESALRPAYGIELLATLDATLSMRSEQWPRDAAQFHEWLAEGPPKFRQLAAKPSLQRRSSVPPAFLPEPAPAEPAPVVWHDDWIASPLPEPEIGTPGTSAVEAVPNWSSADTVPAAMWASAAKLRATALGARSPAESPPTPTPMPTPPAVATERIRTPGLTAPPVSAHRPAPTDGDSADALVTDRAPWSGPPSERQRRNRRQKIAVVAGLLALAGVVLGVVTTGSWNQLPQIALDRLPTALTQHGPTAAQARPPGIGNPDAGIAAIATAPADPVSMPPLPAGDAPTRPGPADPAPIESSSARPIPGRGAADLPDEPRQRDVAPPVANGSADAAAKPVDPALVPVPVPVPMATSPRAACGARTEFSLYRCMQQQCESRRWSSNAQCVRFRETDSVD